MSLFRRFFYRKPPDRLLEISERVYVFDCCYSTDVLEEDEYKLYMDGIVAQLQYFYPDSSFMVFNLREACRRTQISDILSQYDMTIIECPWEYEGCPLLPLEMIHHFLRSSESWLSKAGQQIVLLMHCERGGWPVLAFMLAALLLFRKQYNGEQKTLEMVYKQAPRVLIHLLTRLNPQPSQLRYLHYITSTNIGLDWLPSETTLLLNCVILRFLPFFGEKGCRPVVRLYGQDLSSLTTNRRSKLLSSSAKEARYYLTRELVKIDIHLRVQGDVVLECIHLDDEGEEMIFRVMFHTSFVQSGILILNRDEVDVMWDSKNQMSNDFKAEVLFSDAEALPSMITTETPISETPAAEDFFVVEEIFSNLIDGQNGFCPNENMMDAENADVVLRKERQLAADAFEDSESDDKKKKTETKVYDLGHVNSGLKLTGTVSNEADKIEGENTVNSVGGSDGVGKQNVMSRPKEWQHLQKSLKDIEIATVNFQDCIGKGGFGRVYKGTLFKSGNSIPVAVKRLNEQFGQGLKEFLTEVHLLSGLKHPNVISLLGYCEDGNEKILVYEYAHRGSLAQYLRPSKTTYTFTWLERLKICVDAARGLNYLHSHGREHVPIIHRDIKSANILLDQNWVAKIADFGLSKLTSGDLNSSFVISHACGTQGYCEPEYIITGIVKKESDIYSFGMVLFEVLCGRLCTYTDNDGFLLSAPLAKQYYEKKKLDEIVDSSIREQLSSHSMNKYSAIAYRCLHDDRRQRPPMNLVLKELEELLEIQDQGRRHSQNQAWRYPKKTKDYLIPF